MTSVPNVEWELLREALRVKDDRPQLPKRVFIFGIGGFTGKRLARFCSTVLSSEFTHVSGTTRSKSVGTAELPYEEFVLEPDGTLPPSAIVALEQATHVLSTVPTSSDATLRDGRIERLSKQGQLVWAGYLSTTAAYGDRGCAIVNEGDAVPFETLSPRGKERVQQEEAWLRTGAPVHIFRLPGIYGPGRGPMAKCREPSKRLIYKEGQVFCRVHVDDIVQALVLSMRRPSPGRVYNVCDDEPAPGHTVSLLAYELLGLTPPPLARFEDVQAELSPMLKSFYSECKRVSNDRIKRELAFCCLYPTYREGLPAQLEEERREGFALVPVSSASAAANAPATTSKSLTVSQVTPPLARLTAFVSKIARFLKSLSLSVLAQTRTWATWVKLFFIRYFLGVAVILVDNGSVRPGATLGMRRLAAKLSKRWGGLTVHPTSWRYADRIDADKDLNGEPALLFTPTIERYNLASVVSQGEMAANAPKTVDSRAKFVVTLPLFLGPSAIVARDIPKLLSRGTELIARPLVPMEEEEECLVTRMLLAALSSARKGKPLTKDTKVLLVDHGSPSAEVTRVRRALAARLRAVVYPARVVDCSMERREEPKYDYNEPTLERAFEQSGYAFEGGHVTLVPAFLFPGNHAGPGGDIAQIVDAAKAQHPGLEVTTARLILDEENDDLALELLDQRLKRALL